MAKTEKTFASNRAFALGLVVGGFVAVVLIILGVVLGVTGVFTFMGAVFLSIFGGIFGGIAAGILAGGTFYVIKMWTSTSWGISSKL